MVKFFIILSYTKIYEHNLSKKKKFMNTTFKCVCVYNTNEFSNKIEKGKTIQR